VISLFSGDDRWVWGQHEMDTGIRDQIGLEFGNINVQGSIESQTGSQGWDDLGDESVEVSVSGSLDVQLSSADIVDGFIV